MNPNSVPQIAKSEFSAAERRLAIFLHHTKRMPNELEIARRDFFNHLAGNWVNYRAATRDKDHIEFVSYSDGLGYLSRLHSILYEMKAFLDLYSRFVVRLLSDKPGPNGFNKAKIDGEELSGGRLINWLAGHTTEQLSTRNALVELFTRASREWITRAVHLRDELGHYRDLRGFKHMRISVTKGPAKPKPRDIFAPELSDGR